MTRNLKVLGLALVAVFALSAVAASAASAAKFHSDTGSGHETTITGTQVGSPNVFRITKEGTEGGEVLASVECPNAGTTFHGKIAGNEATEVTVHPVYAEEKKECEVKIKGSSFGKAKVDTEGCNYVLSADTTGEHAQVHIECEAGHEINITGPLGCTIHVPGGQTPDAGVHYVNGESGGKRDVTVHATVREISYTSAGCLGQVPTSGHFADYDSEITVKGDDATTLAPVNVWWE